MLLNQLESRRHVLWQADVSLVRKPLTHMKFCRYELESCGKLFSLDGKFGLGRMSSTKRHILLKGYVTKFLSLRCTSPSHWGHSLFTGESCEFGKWGWDMGRTFGTHRKSEAFGNTERHFFTSKQKYTRVWGTGWDRSCLFPTNKTREKPLG